MTTKIFDNLRNELLNVAQEMTGERRDSRFKDWAKSIAKVNRKATNGYAFDGDWVNDGTIELELKPRVFLVAFTHGSRKYNVTEYAIVTMDANGELHPTEIKTDSGASGWALRIRDIVADLLDSMIAQDEKPAARDRFLTIIKGRFPELTENEIITAALNLYEMHTRN